jgi:hypothetical protein
MRRRAFALAVLLASSTAVGAPRARAGDECAPKVEPAAEKVFSSLLQAMRKASAEGVVALMAPGKEARLSLRLSGVKKGEYPRDQAVEVLKTAYFKTREILSISEDEGCTRGTEARLTRAYRMRVRSGGKEEDGTLKAVIQRGEPGWSLEVLSDS